VLPLVIATGAGAAARRSMGTGVFGGMLIATFIATVFVPLFFVLVARRGRRVANPAHDQHPREVPGLPAGEAK
jgi:Cu/Ag efflux pump CusA